MHVTIDPATIGDGPAILQLLSNSGLPIDGLMAHIDTAIVARSPDRIVGCAALELYADGALLRSLAVDPAARGLMIGHRLTDSVLTLARESGVSAVYLLTTTAQGFFPRFAFSEIDREDVPASVRQSIEFRGACPETAVVMRKILDR